MKKYFATLILFLILAVPCFSEEFTLGIIQRVHSGMSQPEVISCLGAPNMVTKTPEGCEIWVYDKTSQSTKEVYDKRWYWLFFVGRRRGCKNVETSQKTITVTLIFNKDSCLESVSYDSKSF